jgi:hypothetical protein
MRGEGGTNLGFRQMGRLEHDADALLKHFAGMVPETLNSLTSQERHGTQEMVRLRVVVSADGPVEITGVFGSPLEASACRSVIPGACGYESPDFPERLSCGSVLC